MRIEKNDHYGGGYKVWVRPNPSKDKNNAFGASWLSAVDRDPPTLKELNERVRKLELYGTANVDTWIEQHDNRIKALEAKLSPVPEAGAEDRELRIGDWIYLTEQHTCKSFRNTIVQAKRVDCGNPYFDHPSERSGGSAIPGMWRFASQEEIAAHLREEQEKQWDKREGLEILDACVCNPKQKTELIEMVHGTGIPHTNDTIGPNLRWDHWHKKPSLIETSEPKDFNPDYKLNWLPFPVFKRLLIKEVEKRKAEALAREQEKPLEPMQKVVYNTDKGHYLWAEHKAGDPTGNHVLAIYAEDPWCDNEVVTVDRAAFTVVDPSQP